MPFTKDVIIVGGGIWFVYSPSYLQSISRKTVLLLGSIDELGGRIRTQYDKKFQVEKGALF